MAPQDLETLLMLLMGSGLDTQVPGASGLMPVIMPILKKLVPGISSSDPIWDAILTTGKSPYAAWADRMRGVEETASKIALEPHTDSARQQYFLNIQKTIMSRESYRKLQKEKPSEFGNMSYEQYSETKAAGLADNMIFSAMYKYADPDGMRKMAAELQKVYSNMARPAFSRGDREAFSAARTVLNKLFTDEKGNWNFKSEDYGGLSGAGVGRLTAELTKGADLLSGVNTSDASALESAAKRLRDKVKEYAKALEPLRDMFGDDIPGMLDTMKQITGMSVASLGVNRTAKMSQDLAYRFSTGNYNATELAYTTQAVNSRLSSMGVGTYNRVFAAEQAMGLLDMTRSTSNPNFISKSDYEKYVTSFALKSRNSGAEDALALAYSLWRQQKDNQSKTVQDFETALLANPEKNGIGQVDLVRTAMRLANVSNTQDLQAGKYFGAYREAKESQSLARRVEAQNVENNWLAAADSMSMDRHLATAMRTMGNTAWDAMSASERAKSIRNVYDLLMASPELSDMTYEERVKALNAMRDSKTVKALRANGSEIGVDTSNMNVEQMNTLIEGMRYTNPGLLSITRATYGTAKTLKYAAMAKKRADAIKKLNISFAKNGLEFVNEMIEGGYGDNKVWNYMSQTTRLDSAALTEGEKAEFNALEKGFKARAVARADQRMRDLAEYNKMGVSELRGSEDGKKAYKAIMEDELEATAKNIRYGMSDAEALSNRHYRAAVKELVALAKSPENDASPAEKQEWSAQMTNKANELAVLQEMKQDTVDRFIVQHFKTTTEEVGKDSKPLEEAFRNALRKNNGDIDSLKLDGSQLTADQKKELELRGYKFEKSGESEEDKAERIRENKELAQRETLRTTYASGGTENVKKQMMKAALAETSGKIKDRAERNKFDELMESYWSSDEYKNSGLGEASWTEWSERQLKEKKLDQKTLNAATARFNAALRGIGESGSSTDIARLAMRAIGLLSSIDKNTRPQSQGGSTGTPKPEQ